MRIHTRGFAIIVTVLLSGSLLVLFRNDVLFAYQLSRLKSLGCGFAKDVHVEWKPGVITHGCDKFWVHRADSYERFTMLSPYFAGLEADLVFDPQLQKFRVFHPPVEPGNLFAERYFEFNKIAGKQLWLDIKNLDSSSFTEAIRFFENADKLYHIKRNVIIESSQIDFVNSLSLLGFTVSFLVNPERLSSTPNGKVPAKLFSSVRFVSQEDKYVEALKTTFPGKQIITWAISFNNYFDLSRFKQLLHDSSVAVVLINIKSDHYR